MRWILSYCLLFIISLITPVSVFADSPSVVINEFSVAESDDWIELYNPTDTDFDLSGVLLRDETETNKKELTGIVPAKGFLVIDWNSLNKDHDTIRLIGNAEITQTYGTSELAAPQQAQSAGRKEDGTDEWVVFSTPSKGTSNNSSSVYLTPTPTPLNTPTPTKIPTPTKTPSPTRVPTLTRNPTTDDLNNSLLSKEPTGKVLAESDEEEASDPAILDGIATVSSELLTPTEEVQPTIGLKTLGVVRNTTSGVIIIIGSLFFFAACGILLWKKYR